MKATFLLQLFMVLLFLPQGQEGTWRPGPNRVSDARLKPINQTLFYIERNKNANTVFYDANFEKTGVLDAKHPIDVYYILYAVDGKRQNLSMIERMMAYGYGFEKLGYNRFNIKLKALPERPVVLHLDGKGHPVVEMSINGQASVLDRVFVKAKPSMYTNVEYVELYGKNAVTKDVVYEKIVN